MIDRALAFNAPESFYFQLYPVNLILLQEPVPTSESKFRFSIFKGLQKFDENKITTEANFIDTDGTYIMPFRGSQLNFYLPNFNKNRKILFTLKLTQKDANEEYDLGGIDIDPAVFITEFQTNGQNRFEQKIEISEQYAIEFEVYLQKSRFALEKIVKSFQGERGMKSPARERVSPTTQRNSSFKEQRSPVQQTQQGEETEPIVASSIIKSRSKVKESSSHNDEREFVSAQKSQQQLDDMEVEISNSITKDLQAPRNSKTKSEKSEVIISPVVKSRQMKRTSGRNEATIKASQRLSREVAEEVKVVKSEITDNWTNHLQLIVFTIVGILMIYWVMHPTNRA